MTVKNAEILQRELRSAETQCAGLGYVSLTIEVSTLDALAVLETLNETGPCSYMETPADGIAFAAGSPLETWNGTGAERFIEADKWLQSLALKIASVGRPPRVCARFPFHPVSEDTQQTSRLFLPSWQVLTTHGQTEVTLVEPANSGAAQRLTVRAEPFQRFAYKVGRGNQVSNESPVLNEVGGSWFPSAVRRATELIREGAFEKVVLTRAFDWRRTTSFDPYATLHRLRSANSVCHTYLVDSSGGTLVGSTPETLLAIHQDELRTEAVAGTTRRGSSPSEDAALADALLASEKDNREHNVVTASILRRLRMVGIEGAVTRKPELLRLGKVMHLRTPVIGMLPSTRRFLEVAGELHPTPAVGGKPRAQALPFIPGFEPHDRGLYTGAVGWVGLDGRSGELIVALRCAELAGGRARAYAGAGIVDGSDPAAEANETEMKLRTILDSLV